VDVNCGWRSNSPEVVVEDECIVLGKLSFEKGHQWHNNVVGVILEVLLVEGLWWRMAQNFVAYCGCNL